ncbi:glycosyl hydrolase family 28-related protein [Bacillus altitudinis]|uniref:glycosyl hydrolase family 28-related protein n=1 Tax=Bacillus altitudinis TaxID=293387 RepID=UPI003F7C3E6D
MALEKDMPPINTMAVKDEDTGDWIPLDAVALRSHKARLTIDDILDNFQSIDNTVGDPDVLPVNGDSLSEKIKNEFNNRGINVKWMGAKADGKTDDANAIQSAIDYAKANDLSDVFIPSGKYYISKGLNTYSNINIYGVKGTKLVFNTIPVVFSGIGSFGQEKNLATTLTNDVESFETVENHELSPGDLVYLLSQRDSLSNDAGDNWRLGNSTPNVPGCYFGEFQRVAETPTNNSVRLTNSVLFPDYRPDRTQETSSLARSNATVQKFNPIENASISNIEFSGKASRLVSFVMGYNCDAESLKWYSTGDGAAIVFDNSFKCEGRKIDVFYPANSFPETIYSRNAFKAISSQNCGFNECFADHGSQSFDITYKSKSSPSVHCYVSNSKTRGATQNPLTTHGGTYGFNAINNQFLDNRRNGISIRTRNSRVVSNTVSGSNISTTSSYGISLYDGWARDCLISVNTISGFNSGIAVIEASTSNNWFTWVGAEITNNTVTNVNKVFKYQKHENNKSVPNAGIKLMNNTGTNMVGQYAKFVHLGSYVAGVSIVHNTFDGSNVANGGVYCAENSTDIHIENNSFSNITTRGVWVLQPTDNKVFPNKESSLYLGNNNFYGVNTKHYVEKNVSLLTTYITGSLHPIAPNGQKQLIGWSGAPWDAVYTQSGVITTSDVKMKTKIEDEKLGLDFVNKLRAVTYKLIDGERTHHGLIAQELEKAAVESGVDINDFAPITKTETADGVAYGVRHNELLGILIKAIQDLDDKFTKFKK